MQRNSDITYVVFPPLPNGQYRLFLVLFINLMSTFSVCDRSSDCVTRYQKNLFKQIAAMGAAIGKIIWLSNCTSWTVFQPISESELLKVWNWIATVQTDTDQSNDHNHVNVSCLLKCSNTGNGIMQVNYWFNVWKLQMSPVQMSTIHWHGVQNKLR